MEKILFVYGWLSVLTDGRFFRFIFSNLLRVTAIILTIYLIGDAIENIERLLFSERPERDVELLAPAAVQAVLLLGGYTVIHLILLRAAEIRTLYDSRYALSEVITVLNRLLGETLFAAILSSTLVVLLQRMESSPLVLLPQLQQQIEPWLSNHSELWILGGGLVLSFGVLIVGYLSSEMLEMVMRLSRNSEKP
ncbi:MAG: hypothetical protein HOL04_08230 [Gammaproteobacteria bacterium]|jgi:hypothetical protein|nr:hypothetical protein [Gammaproteobacteria bacterium]MBT5361714.1 hypothetical protein [Gammaproteobacteria bacterium]MBT8006589.1 hypothetical protein [Gammaproteobacteria bacterium]